MDQIHVLRFREMNVLINEKKTISGPVLPLADTAASRSSNPVDIILPQKKLNGNKIMLF